MALKDLLSSITNLSPTALASAVITKLKAAVGGDVYAVKVNSIGVPTIYTVTTTATTTTITETTVPGATSTTVTTTETTAGGVVTTAVVSQTEEPEEESSPLVFIIIGILVGMLVVGTRGQRKGPRP